jgi:hypothetical protein
MTRWALPHRIGPIVLGGALIAVSAYVVTIEPRISEAAKAASAVIPRARGPCPIAWPLPDFVGFAQGSKKIGAQ